MKETGTPARLVLSYICVKAIAALLALSTVAAARAATIAIEGAYPSDGAGNPVQVEVGDSFYMTARLNVDSPLSGTYRIRFDLPYFSRTTPPLSFGGEARVVWGPYPALTAGSLAVKTTVLPNGDRAGQPVTIRIDPTLPSQGVEFFNTQSLSGSVSATARLSAGPVAGLHWYLPVPQTGGFQLVQSLGEVGTVSLSQPFWQPVEAVPGRQSVELDFQTEASSSRVNPAILRTAGFDGYRGLPADVSCWLSPETLVESSSAEVGWFVARTLPPGYRRSMKPYDAAEKLFRAVVARMRYAATGALPDALSALRSGRGDCGAFSSAFVAACRNAGIPARAVTGLTFGTDQWHVWAEFYLAGFGWIPVDPSYCDSLCPDGSSALYFGTIPDLNGRVALSYGFDHSLPGHPMPILQSPAVFASDGSRVRSVEPSCSLQIAG